MRKYIVISFLSVICIIGLIISFASGNFDILKTTAINSFTDLLLNLDKKKENDSWTIIMPDETTKLTLGAKDNRDIVMLTLDINPFLKAGLDISKLPSYMSYDMDKKVLNIISTYGNNTLDSEISITNVYKRLVTTYRNRLSYHHTLDHFGVSLDNGNAFEYAKDLNNNVKDIVIVLNPNAFLNASVQLDKIDGYLYTDVVMNDGKNAKKLLKVFNIEEIRQCLFTKKTC